MTLDEYWMIVGMNVDGFSPRWKRGRWMSRKCGVGFGYLLILAACKYARIAFDRNKYYFLEIIFVAE